jgi:D-inositol-3-phosphate glycosyltransferase
VFQKKIAREAALFKPDIVHVHHGWALAPVVAELDVPYIITLHGTEYLGLEKYPDYRKLALRGLRNARLIVAFTEHDREQAIRTYRLKPQKVMVVRSGVDTEAFKPLPVDKERLLQSYAIRECNRRVVFFGGKLTAIKGVDVLLRAARVYSQIDERPLTLIAGDGDVREDLERLAEELKLDDVHFLGHQGRQQMVRLFNAADVVALPSRTGSFPLVAMEALACGTPVVASDVGGFREMINEQVGYLVESGDPAALAEKIAASIQEGFKEKAHQAAVELMRQDFSWEKTVSCIESTYKRCLTQ